MKIAQNNHADDNSMVNKYRSRDEIIYEILLLLADSPQIKTRIMYRAYLSYEQLKFYEAYLIEKRLIEQIMDKIALTQKGRAYLIACQKAQEILET
jgi:predicted transcriptional regulator